MSKDKRQLGFRIERSVADEIEQYADERGMSMSDALRDISRDWYEERTEPEPSTSERFNVAPVRTVGAVLFLLAPATLIPRVLGAWGTALSTVSPAPVLEAAPAYATMFVSIFIGSALLWWADRDVAAEKNPTQNPPNGEVAPE